MLTSQDIAKEYYLRMVRRNPPSLQFIDDQDEDICLEAVKVNGEAIRFVKEPTEKVVKAAIENSIAALDYKNENWDDAWIVPSLQAAMNKDGLRLKDVPQHLRDRDVCIAAVKNNGLAWAFVPKELQATCYSFAAQQINKNHDTHGYPAELWLSALYDY